MPQKAQKQAARVESPTAPQPRPCWNRGAMESPARDRGTGAPTRAGSAGGHAGGSKPGYNPTGKNGAAAGRGGATTADSASEWLGCEDPLSQVCGKGPTGTRR